MGASQPDLCECRAAGVNAALFFDLTFLVKNRRFTKTGSEQTQRTLKRGRFASDRVRRAFEDE
jgi:hypothetical protein